MRPGARGAVKGNVMRSRPLLQVQSLIDEEEESHREREAAAKHAWCKILQKHPQLGKVKFESVANAVAGLEYLTKFVLVPQHSKIDGEVAWKMIDTYGMSLDVVADVAIATGRPSRVRPRTRSRGRGVSSSSSFPQA